MPPTLRPVVAVLLALLTALTYGVANYLGPLLSRRLPLAAVLLGGQAAALLGAAALTAGSAGLAGFRIGGRALVLALAAGCVNGGALAMFTKAGQVGDLSVVAPIGSTGAAVPVLVALVSGERPGPVALVGIPVALVGITFAARRPPTGGDSGRVAVAWALASALAFGGFLTVFAAAAGYGAGGALFWSRLSLLLSTTAVVGLLRPPMRAPLRSLLPAAVPGLLLVLGTFAYGEATRRGLLAVVSVIATLSPVVTVGLALVVLRERLGRAQRVGVLVALVGVVLLAAG